MEIVLAALLLFGGFTLGSITADKGDDDVQSTMSRSNGGDVPDLSQVTQVLRQSDPGRCHSGRAVIYRDLTVPYHRKIDQPTNQAVDCESECQNE